MRILLVNKFHYLKGGSEKYYFELGELLKEHGNEVAYFSMKDDRNIVTGDKEYFVEQIDLNKASKLKAFDVIYSKENKKKMQEALEDFKPDIVHLNNFQRQLSASIIDAIKEKNIPIVFTAHDLQAICPAISMLDSKQEVCEKCLGGKYSNCFKNKCNKGSTLKSLIGTLEGRYYKKNRIYSEKIDHIITPTEFYKGKLIEDGISLDKITTIYNYIDADKYNVERTDEDYALYIGRLSKEKGIFNLVQAFRKVKGKTLYIAGEGPEKENIDKMIRQNRLGTKVQLLGFLNKDEIKEKISRATMVIVPSIWYENCPYSVLETLAIGKPIIGSWIGGIPELVRKDKTGLLFEYNNVQELAEKINYLFDNRDIAKEFGDNAKELAKQEFSKEKYYDELMKIYNNVSKDKEDDI